MTKTTNLLIFIVIITMLVSCSNSEESNVIKTYTGQTKKVEDLNEFLKTQMDSLGIPALSIAIINDGEITYHNALGVTNTITKKGITKGSIFEAASLSKPVSAFFMMKLSEKGIIDLDRPLYFYLPDEEMEIDQRYKDVTARMVLSHRTGFPNWRWFDKPPEGVDINRGDFFMINDPNTTFTYSGEAYSYLERVIAHLSFINMYEMNDLFQKEVGSPFEMEHAYFVYDDYLYNHKVRGHRDGKPTQRKWSTGLPNENSLVFGSLNTEAQSYAHFITAIINKKGLYPETYKEMLSPFTVIPKDNVSYTNDGITHWSLGFGIKPMANDTIYRHGGSNKGFQSEFAFSVNQKYGYVFFVNCEKGNEFNEKLEAFLEMGLD